MKIKTQFISMPIFPGFPKIYTSYNIFLLLFGGRGIAIQHRYIYSCKIISVYLQKEFYRKMNYTETEFTFNTTQPT